MPSLRRLPRQVLQTGTPAALDAGPAAAPAGAREQRHRCPAADSAMLAPCRAAIAPAGCRRDRSRATSSRRNSRSGPFSLAPLSASVCKTVRGAKRCQRHESHEEGPPMPAIDRAEADRRQCQPAPRQGRRQADVDAPRGERQPGRSPRRTLQRRRDLRRGLRERPRRGHVHHPADLAPRQRQPDGTADHHRRPAPLVGRPDHRGHPLLRLCPPGPPDQGPHADLRQAGRQPDHPGRDRARADDGPARRADPGLLRHPRRQPLRQPDLRAGYPANFRDRWTTCWWFRPTSAA